MTQKTWFITGTSRGFGREWTSAALERGDRVAATARDISTLDDLVEKYGEALLPLELDVTSRDDAFAAVDAAVRMFGRLDVVVNNAGYGHFGFIEELTEDEIRAQMETNLFGALWVTQAALPYLREQGSRATSSRCRRSAGSPRSRASGRYHASKWALEGFSQALAGEVAAVRHQRDDRRARWVRHRLGRPVVQALRAAAGVRRGARSRGPERKARAGSGGPGDPEASAAALLKVVDAEEPPLRVFFGDTPIDVAKADYKSAHRDVGEVGRRVEAGAGLRLLLSFLTGWRPPAAPGSGWSAGAVAWV